MSRWERYGTRSLAFSEWQRSLPEWSRMIDIDGAMYCPLCDETFAFIEEARDVGQSHKATKVMRKVAIKCGQTGLLVFSTLDARGKITSFRVRRVAPTFSRQEVVMSPSRFGEYIHHLLMEHQAQSGCNNHRNPLRRREAR